MGQIVDCIRELGFIICKVLFTYHSILLFHIDEDERLEYEKCGWLLSWYRFTTQILISLRYFFGY